MKRITTALLLVGLGLGFLASSPVHQTVCASSPDALLDAIRNARGDQIPTHSVLMRESQSRVREIVTDFSHDGANHPYAEILAWNAYPEEFTEAAAVNQWLDASGHSRVMLGDWTHIGVATADSGVKHFYVALFTNFSDRPPPLLPATDTEGCP